MSIETLVKALQDAKFKVYYGVAPDGTSCPYVVLINVYQPNFGADNKTFTETTSLDIRLVESEVHDWTLISTLKGILDGLSLPYNTEDLYEPSEHICETNINIRFLGGMQNGK